MTGSRARDKGLAAASFAVVAALLTAVASGRALAQDERTTALARDLFRQGVELADHGDWAQARDRFERAYELRRSAVIAFNLASACAHVGRLVEAVERFDEVRRDAGAAADARAASERAAGELRPRIGRLTIAVTGPRDGVTFALGDDPLPAALVGVEAPADPGHHVIVATRDGAEVARAEVDVPEGGAASASLTVPPPAVHVPTPDETARRDEHAAPVLPPHEPSIVESPWLWVGIGAGVLAVAAVIVVAVVVSQPQAMLPAGDTMPGTIRW